MRGRVADLPGLYSDDILNEIARANDIVEVVSQYFPLKRAGKEYKALCPFHAEKSPSFYVNPAKQIFKCFGCGRGGGVFNFVMAKENVTFPEAVRMLADRAGIDLGSRARAEEGAGRRRQVRDVLEWAAQRFQAGLAHPTAGAPGREYLDSRAIAPETIAAFRIGYAPAGWDNLIRAAGRDDIGIDLLEQAGLVIRREDGGYYDRFRGRVMFPILDTLTRPIAFGGRALGDEQPKYLNSPETAIFHKGEALYGLAQARAGIEAEKRAVVVEGYFDVVLPHQAGVKHVVATLGTALTEEHVRALKRYADDVVLVFDSDLAGQRAADRGVELFLAADVKISIAVVPQGKDPYDFCRAEGAEAFRALLAAARDALRFKWDLAAEEFGAAAGPAAQRRALEAMLASIARAPVFARADLRLQRDLILGHMSRVLGIAEETLRSEFSRLRRTAGRAAAGTQQGAALSEQVARGGRRWIKERELMTVLVCRPSWLENVMPVLPPDRVADAQFRRLYESLASNPTCPDGDIESIVLRIEDTELASLAVELFERGEAQQACRDAADTGPGPLGEMLAAAVADLKDMQDEAELAARRRAAGAGETGGAEALRAFAESRVQHQGFVPPAARRRGDLGDVTREGDARQGDARQG
ncbi:MAG: DNA primase [Planctomycetes bacterium]|nr:DNA primase [Planctomycetota bacterium]